MSHFDNESTENEQSMEIEMIESNILPEEEPFYYQGKYLLNEFWYHENFPLEWAKHHEEETGPSNCNNCAYFGSINGIFIGYCCNCADYVYNFERGRGFIDIGVEDIADDSMNHASAFDTYLKGVDIEAIEPVIDESNYNNEMDIGNEYDEYDNDNTIVDDYNENSYIGVMDCHFEGGYNDF
jgi:hypothetical protein